jgi:hypothetical protein
MKKAIYILLLVFYSLGTLFLPLGDFSFLQDLPQMYQHCKTTEDKDMTAFDFITDHLINIDSIFDKHDNGDEQKPHTPVQYQSLQQQTIYLVNEFEIPSTKPISLKNKFPDYPEIFYSSDYIFKIFRPPVFA